MQLGNFTYTSVKGVAYIQNVSLHKVIKDCVNWQRKSAPHFAINMNELFFLNFK
jgi:hypothetical protein